MGQPLSVPPGFDELPVEEQIDYVHRLWERISGRQQDVPSPKWHREEVRAAVVAHREDPEGGASWSDVREDIEAKLKLR